MIEQYARPVIFVSKCLGIESCRYNGDIIPNKFIDKLKSYVDIKTVCPEVSIGMGIPREPARIVHSKEGYKFYQPGTGIDWTNKMTKFSDKYLDEMGEVDGFIMKYRSPSCAVSNAKVYSSVDAKIHKNGPGLFGGEIIKRFKGLAIEDEGRLNNYTIRENFLIKIFMLADFRGVKSTNKISELTKFHAKNKLLLMAFDQEGMRKIGSIAANTSGKEIEETFEEYAAGLKEAISSNWTAGSWINALMHAFGYFKKELSKDEKDLFLKYVEEYRDERIPLVVLIRLIESWAVKYDDKYILSQTFISPYPIELLKVTDSGKGRV